MSPVKIVLVVVLVAGIVGLVGTFLVQWLTADKNSERHKEVTDAQREHEQASASRDEHVNEKVEAVSSTLESELKSVGGLTPERVVPLADKLTVFFGGAPGRHYRNHLETGHNLEQQQVISVYGEVPFKFRLEKKTLLVSFTARDANRAVMAEVVDNEWGVNMNKSLKRNFDEHAFEVLDEFGNVCCSVYFFDSNTIMIQGVFSVADRLLISTERSLTLMPNLIHREDMWPAYSKANRTDFMSAYQASASEVKRMFKYVGEDWFGTRIHTPTMPKPVQPPPPRPPSRNP